MVYTPLAAIIVSNIVREGLVEKDATGIFQCREIQQRYSMFREWTKLGFTVNEDISIRLS